VIKRGLLTYAECLLLYSDQSSFKSTSEKHISPMEEDASIRNTGREITLWNPGACTPGAETLPKKETEPRTMAGVRNTRPAEYAERE
ncbi:hypothetical protein P7K49_010849, partial [Saguinus oedipus]